MDRKRTPPVNPALPGVILLAAVLLLCALVSGKMCRGCGEICQTLTRAEAAATKENWKEAEELTAQAWRNWQSLWKFAAFFADHNALEEADGLFAQLKIYGRRQEGGEFSALCEALIRQITAVGDAQKLRWRNLL